MEHNEDTVKELFKDHGILTVIFTKANGDKRQMTCTKDMEIIPEEFHPKPLGPGQEPKKKNPLLCTVFEIGVGWRSFYYSKIISIEVMTPTE